MKPKKCDSVFTDNDFNSSDGMLTSVWGPSMWHCLHTISFNYPVNPNSNEKKDYYKYFRSLERILPCKYCRDNLKKNYDVINFSMDCMENRDTLSKAIYNLHEEVNSMLLKKSNLTYEEVRNRYELFRSRCLEPNSDKKAAVVKKSKKEKGCVKPLYGIKSKCVINIVPKTKKCKSFNIDKRCKLKRK